MPDFRFRMIRAIATIVALCGAASSYAAPAGQIAFVMGTEQEDQRVHIFDLATMQSTPVGAGRRDGAPVWSPDGSQLAFEAQTDDGYMIHIVNADGTGLRAISKLGTWNEWPRWSPDGKRLAYSTGEGLDMEAVVCDLATGVEEVWGGRKGLLNPIWFDNNTLLVLAVLNRDKKATLNLHTVTKSTVVRLPENARTSDEDYVEWAPEIFPKKLTLAFETNDGGDREIYILDMKTGCHNLSNDKAADWNPHWSPSGEWVAFESFRGGRRGVYRVFASTARVMPVAASEEYDNWSPAWSPDGNWIAFASNRSGKPALLVTEVEGEQLIEIPLTSGYADAPAWRPSTKKAN